MAHPTLDDIPDGPVVAAKQSAYMIAKFWLPVLVLCIAAMLLLWRVMLGGIFLPLDIIPHLHPWRFSYERVPVNNAIISDVVRQIYPRRWIANQIIAQGAWPLWNPTILTGTPLLADGQVALFYPLSLVFLLVPLPYAFGLYTLVNVALAGIGCYAFARTIRLGVGASMVVGLCFMYSGFFLSWLQFPEFSGATAMLPWCFWAVARACEKPRWGRWLVAAAVLALPLVTQIQIAFYAYVAAGCYVLARMAGATTWRARGRIFAGWCMAVVLALALGAVQVLPQIALSAEGQRSDIGSGLGSADFYFMALLRLIFPLAGGTPRTEPLAWGPSVLQVPQAYAGILPLILAFVALVASRHRDLRFFALLAVGSFALALSTPLLTLFITIVPPYRQFADHTRWFVVWGFAVAVAAGMGAHALATRNTGVPLASLRSVWVQRAMTAVGVVLLGVWAWRHLAMFTPQSRYGEYFTLIQSYRSVPFVLAGLGVVAVAVLAVRRVSRSLAWGVMLCLIGVDLHWYGSSYNTTTTTIANFHPTDDLVAALAAQPSAQSDATLYPPTRQTTFLLSQPGPFRILGGDYLAMPANVLSAYGLEDVRGYQSLYLARYNRLTRLIDGKDYTRLGEGSTSLYAYFTSAYEKRRLLDMLNVEFIVFPPESDNIPRYEPLELVQKDDEGSIYRNPQVLPRAWLVHDVETLVDDAAQLDRLADPRFDPAMSAVVASDVPAVAPAVGPEPVPSVRYTPNRAFVQASASAPALLVLSDAYTDDWRVTVDGVAAPLVRTNYALRGVWLPAGTHELVFSYRPRSFVVGGSVSLATLSGIVGWALWNRRRVWVRSGKAMKPAA